MKFVVSAITDTENIHADQLSNYAMCFSGSNVALNLEEITKVAPVVQVSSTSTSPYLDDTENFARKIPSDGYMMRAIVEMVSQLSPAESYPSLIVIYNSKSAYSTVS